MTNNHRKANEFANTQEALINKGSYRDGVYDGAVAMADWKDKSIKQTLDEHLKHATGERSEAFMDLYRELFEPND